MIVHTYLSCPKLLFACIFLDDGCLGKVVHDLGVVGADKMAIKMLACHPVYDIAIDLAVSVYDTTLAREVFVFGMNMKSVRLMFHGTEFATQILIIHIKTQLISVGGFILHPIVNIIIGDAGACAKRDLTAMIGEKIQCIMMMMFRDGEVAVEHHPVDEVGELAHAASDALAGFSMRDGESFLIASALCGAPDEFPYGEGLSGMNEQSVDVLDCQSEVDRLVFLQLHVHIAQTATDERIVAIDDHRERVLGAFLSKADTVEHVLDMTLQDFLLRGQTVSEWRDFAE